MIKNIFAAFTSLFFSLLILEAGVRVFCPLEPEAKPVQGNWVNVPEQKWAHYDAVLGWTHEKSKTATLETPQIHVELHTNNAGMRGDRDYELVKNPSVTRLVVLGDSFPFGFGVKDDEVFTQGIESAGRPLEVLNFGVPGYGMDQVLLLYRQTAREYKPDVVLIHVFHEMFWRSTRRFAASGYAKPYFKLSKEDELLLMNVPVPEPYKLQSDQYPELFEYGPIESLFMRSVLYVHLRERTLRWGRKLHLIDPDMSDDWILGRRILEQLIDEVRADGAVPVMVIVPPENWVRGPEKNQLRRSLLRFADREEVLYLDLSEAFYEAGLQSSVEDYYIAGDWHWNARGHALVAQELEKFLAAENLIPRAGSRR